MPTFPVLSYQAPVDIMGEFGRGEQMAQRRQLFPMQQKAAKEKLMQEQLANQLQQKYGEQMMQQKLAGDPLKDALTKAKIEQTNWRNQNYVLNQINQLYKTNPTDPRLKSWVNYYHKLTDPSKGIAVNIGAQPIQSGQGDQGGQNIGKPIVSQPDRGVINVGGASPFGAGQQGIPGVMTGQKIALPETGITKGGSAGKTFIDLLTGQITSAPTPQQVSQLQKGIIAYPKIERSVGELVNNLGDFLSAKSKIDLAKSMAKGLGGDEEAASKVSRYATGKAELEAMPERLLSMMNLNATDKTIDKVSKIITPLTGETKKSYSSRVNRKLKEFYQDAIKDQQMLRGGISLGQEPYLYQQVPVKTGTIRDILDPQYKTVRIPNPNYRQAQTAQTQSGQKTANNDPLGIR